MGRIYIIFIFCFERIISEKKRWKIYIKKQLVIVLGFKTWKISLKNDRYVFFSQIKKIEVY